MVEVVAALVHDTENPRRFLICQRPAYKTRGLLWEFVGGKVEPGETKREALARECREELGVAVSVGDVYMELTHVYPDLTIHLTLFHAEITDGVPQLLEHCAMDWITPEEIKAQGFDAYFVDHTLGVFPQAAAGVPWNAISIGVSGDVIADLTEDLAAEQKARATYDNILRLSDDPDVNNVIRFLREREVVHFQRFGEALGLVTEKLNQNNVYYMNPAFPGR